jgi:hypothetical protein
MCLISRLLSRAGSQVILPSRSLALAYLGITRIPFSLRYEKGLRQEFYTFYREHYCRHSGQVFTRCITKAFYAPMFSRKLFSYPC